MINDLGRPLNGMTKEQARAWLERLRSPTVTAKTVNERVETLRAAREAQGMKRCELYAHPDDWLKIKAFSESLKRKRGATTC